MNKFITLTATEAKKINSNCFFCAQAIEHSQGQELFKPNFESEHEQHVFLEKKHAISSYDAYMRQNKKKK